MKRLSEGFAWSFHGCVITVLFGLVALYVAFLYERRPAIAFALLSSGNVVDVREDVHGLAIVYEGTDIRDKGQSLRMIVLKVINSGSKDILKGHYDERDALGVQVCGGRIVKCELLEASSEYLSRNLRLRINLQNKVTFSPVIFESHEYFLIKLLVLHSARSQPTIRPTGKVAGLKRIVVTEAYTGDPRTSFFRQAFAGRIAIQLARLPAYFLGFILLCVALGTFVTRPLIALTAVVRHRVTGRNASKDEDS